MSRESFRVKELFKYLNHKFEENPLKSRSLVEMSTGNGKRFAAALVFLFHFPPVPKYFSGSIIFCKFIQYFFHYYVLLKYRRQLARDVQSCDLIYVRFRVTHVLGELLKTTFLSLRILSRALCHSQRFIPNPRMLTL